jgi:hypothetical protein
VVLLKKCEVKKEKLISNVPHAVKCTGMNQARKNALNVLGPCSRENGKTAVKPITVKNVKRVLVPVL